MGVAITGALGASAIPIVGERNKVGRILLNSPSRRRLESMEKVRRRVDWESSALYSGALAAKWIGQNYKGRAAGP
jgi:hypothetical protein